MITQAFTGNNRVVNIEHLHGDFLGFAAPENTLPQRGLIALTLVNRQPQLNAIIDRLETITKDRAGGPLLVILPGVRSDFHQAFVLRCGLLHFSNHYDRGVGWSYLGRLPWPHGARTITPILWKIRDGIGLPSQLKEPGDIEAHLASLQKSICFSHLIESRSWNSEQRALVLDWIDYLHTGWPSLPPGCFVVAFLCLDVGTSQNRSMVKFLQQLRAQQRDDGAGTILVTDALDLIGPSDIDDWVSEAGRYLGDPTLEARLWTAADDLFVGKDNRRRFGEIYKELCNKLSSAFVTSVNFGGADE